MVGTETFTVESPDGDSEEVELAEGLVDLMAEQGESTSAVVTDVVLQAFAQQAHMIAHHSEGQTPPDIVEIEEKMGELYEQRFGQTLEDALGHSH